MDLTEDMNNLIEDIKQSEVSRGSCLYSIKVSTEKLREEARKAVEEMHNERVEISSELREKLAAERDRLFKDVQAMLEKLSKVREADTDALRKSLEKSLNDLRLEIEELLKTNRKLRQDMSIAMQKEFQEADLNRRKEVEELRKKTQELMQEFSNSMQEMARALRESLSQSTTERKVAVQQMLEKFREELSKVREDIIGAANVWREFCEAKKKVVIEGVPEEKAEEVFEISQETLEQETSQEEQSAMEELEPLSSGFSEQEEFSQEGIDFRTKMLEIIKAHPEGISLSDIADMLGVAYVVLSRDIRALLDEGKIRREGKFYLPVADGD